MSLPDPEPEIRRRDWDPVVKLTHWGIVVAVIANAIVTHEGSAAHVWVGYGLAVLLGLRLLWGLIGPAEARFSAFPPSPRRALAHVGEIAAGTKTVHASHNPLGALMVYAIWGTLGVIIATGIAMAGLPSAGGASEKAGRQEAAGKPGAPEARGDAVGDDHDDDHSPRAATAITAAAPVSAPATLAGGERDEDSREAVVAAKRIADERRRERSGAAPGLLDPVPTAAERDEAREEREEGPLGEVHEVAVNLLYLLIALHLAGVIFETRRSGREIVLAMAPGRR